MKKILFTLLCAVFALSSIVAQISTTSSTIERLSEGSVLSTVTFNSGGDWRVDATDDAIFVAEDGVYISSNTSNIYMNTNSVERLRITSGGDVGIGTTNPTSKLEVSGDAKFSGGTIIIGERSIKDNGSSFMFGSMLRPDADNLRDLGMPTRKWNTLYVNSIGVGTGNIPSGYKFAIDGNMIAERVRVQSSGSWPDYVFEDNYDLMSLEALKKSIQIEGHLPNIPDAATVEAEGHDLGEIQAKLLEKIEELTLYVIELNDRIKALERENKQLNSSNK